VSSIREIPPGFPLTDAQIISFLGLIALRQFGRQRGWITSQFRISLEALNLAMESYDEALVETNVASNSVARLNEEAGFVENRPDGIRSS
jgi:hypothetical protein